MANTQEHLSENIIKDIIGKMTKSHITILSTEKEYVLPPGENYISELLRIIVKFCNNNSKEVKSMSLITKVPLEDDIKAGREDEMMFFSSEITIYSKILPLLSQLGFTQKISPTVYHTSNDPRKLLVLEDLTLLQYKMPNRLEGLDLEHCLRTIEKLAYFHAASLALYEKNPKIMDSFDRGAFFETKPLKSWTSVTFKEAINVCIKHPNLQKYASKMREDILDKYRASRKLDSKLNVLNHGDFWCNNIMFQYSENGDLNDVVFVIAKSMRFRKLMKFFFQVDYQIASFTTPFFDLHLFLATTPNLEVKKEHTKTILCHYYEELCKNGNIFKLKTKIPSRQEFDQEFVDKAYIGLEVKVTSLHHFKADKREDVSITDFLKMKAKEALDNVVLIMRIV
ncbi:hypothetical protein FQR65_LT02071 [Abscondita terminalis]|nr:hypothetical protein FQR65_LT02071 [Abscondita terminalis]